MKALEEYGFNCKCGYNATFMAKQLPNKIIIIIQCLNCATNYMFEKPVQKYENKGDLEQIEMELNGGSTEKKQSNEETTKETSQIVDTEKTSQLQEEGQG